MTGRMTAMAVVAALAAGCGGSGSPTVPAPSAAATIHVTSSAFGDNGVVPAGFTCRGAGQAPPLAWSGASASRALALVVDDPDAPGGTFVHWIVLDLSGGTTSLPAGGVLPAGAAQAQNSAGRAGWTPPCPPSGTHHYRFTVYALRERTGLGNGTAATDALAAIGRLATARGQLVGLVSA
jgi:Raf kinase inhibitor-like YbhB/YbcL family protein